MNQKRWFIGIALPAELSTAISRVQHAIFDEHTMLEPLVPHITLIHPNPLMEISPLYFAPLAKQAAEQLLPCDITLESIDQFRSDVLYLSVKSTQLRTIYDALVAALPPAIQSSYFVGKEFVSHVTIAQTKSGQSLGDEVIQQAEHQMRTIVPCSFTVTELTRFERQSLRNFTAKNL